MAKLILFSGPPGVGKSTLSYNLAQQTGWALLTRDQVDRSLEHVNISNKDAGYEVLLGLTKLNLQNNVSVIIDAVFRIEEGRKRAEQIAKDSNAELFVIVCTCSDTALWKSRIEDRPEVVEGWTPADWEEAQRVHALNTKWDIPHLKLDSVNPLNENLQKLYSYVGLKS
jgi:predicted kinase